MLEVRGLGDGEDVGYVAAPARFDGDLESC